MTQPLGRLERVDVRKVWLGEASDFTPWLGLPENIKLLGEAIGIDLEVEAQEKGVGPFRADILCKDTTNGHYVLVENQLERTDHVHLGQLLTYAAGLEAVTVVWVAPRFTDEHRAALDWLNQKTTEDLNFFGLEIEVWRIGGSAMAPKFNLVSQPNDWTKTIKQQAAAASSAGFTAFQQLHIDYWTQFKFFLEERDSSVRIGKPSKESWADIALGRTNFFLQASNGMRDNQSWVDVKLVGPYAKQHFELLRERHKAAIDDAVPGQVAWRLLPNNKESQIRVARQSEPSKPETWPALMGWMADILERWAAYLRPVVKTLVVPNESPYLETNSDSGAVGEARL